MAKLKPYNKRTDLEKIQSQWVKLTGLHDRTDWSAAVVRAATATEIAVNFAIRQEFAAQSQFDEIFVGSLLIWANGLNGKLDKLLLPLLRGEDKTKTVGKICSLAKNIHKKRNDIVHSGHFCAKGEAKKLIEDCRNFVHGIVRLYDQGFTLKERPSGKE